MLMFISWPAAKGHFGRMTHFQSKEVVIAEKEKS